MSNKELKYLIHLKTKTYFINYKNLKFLFLFINPFGNILSKEETLISSKQHRYITKAIKKAKALNLIPSIITKME